MQRIRNQPRQIFKAKRREVDFLYLGSRFADRIELSHERMGGAHLVVAVSADQQQVPYVLLG